MTIIRPRIRLCAILTNMRISAWLALMLAPATIVAQKQPFTVDAMLKIQRIGDPQLSPDGKTVAFGVSKPDLDANKNLKSIWAVPTMGGAPRKLADLAERPRWAPDGKRIFFTGTQGGASQIWSMKPDGSDSQQVTHLA